MLLTRPFWPAKLLADYRPAWPTYSVVKFCKFCCHSHFSTEVYTTIQEPQLPITYIETRAFLISYLMQSTPVLISTSFHVFQRGPILALESLSPSMRPFPIEFPGSVRSVIILKLQAISHYISLIISPSPFSYYFTIVRGGKNLYMWSGGETIYKRGAARSGVAMNERTVHGQWPEP
jgi:hypothetical protein